MHKNHNLGQRRQGKLPQLQTAGPTRIAWSPQQSEEPP